VTPGDVWLAAYAALAVICAATVLLRHEPTLVRGRSIFLFTVLYVAIAWGFLAWREAVVPPRVWITAVVALGVSALVAPWWFVLGGPRTAVVAIMEICFGRVCAQYEHVDAGFVMTVPGGGGLHVGLYALPSSRVTVLSFRARPAHRKSDLFRRLLVKQYQGPLPTIRIRMR
jgi:hypothetical protein